MKYCFIFIFALCYIVFNTNIGYTDTSPMWTHFTFQFQHAGIFHLIINSLSFIGMFRLMQKFVNRWLLSVSIIATGFTASFLSTYSIPTVGASAMVYAMVGMFFSMLAFSPNIKILDKKKFAVFVV